MPTKQYITNEFNSDKLHLSHIISQVFGKALEPGDDIDRPEQSYILT